MTRPSSSPPALSHSGALQARFLSIVSHELRTPLTTIASFTESLDTDELSPAERSQAVSAVRRNTHRMLALADDLMLVSRLQSGDLEMTPTRVDPAAVVDAAVTSLAAHDAPTSATVAGCAPPVLGDRTLLELLVYAVVGTVAAGAADRRATVDMTGGPAGVTITVTARQAEEATDESLMAGLLAIGEPPHRRRSTALWMLLADAIATRHGGSVELTFDAGTGAGAVIELPAAAAEPA
ncbi:MAG TPA: histidine kinase dimerization/phospho-acceptor domain-containing protein [Actinoplanes sp.]|nr:histidine kinase dimerization/phospho-acceptor domain-containing protein [Actinoplanes sp.]